MFTLTPSAQMSAHREPVTYQEPLFLLCHGGPTDGEWRPTIRTWWPIGEENGGRPIGIYIRKAVRGGAVFQWYELGLTISVFHNDFHNSRSGLDWIDQGLRDFMNKHFPRGHL